MNKAAAVTKFGGRTVEWGVNAAIESAKMPYKLGRMLLLATLNEALKPPHVPDELREHYLERAEQAQEDIKLAASFGEQHGVGMGEARLADALVTAHNNAFVTPDTVQAIAKRINSEYFRPDINPHVSDDVANEALRLVDMYGVEDEPRNS